MIREFTTSVMVLAIATGVCFAQSTQLSFQYRFRREFVPASRADEPLRDQLSSQLLKTHVEKAVDLWSKQQKCVSCHTHGIYMQVRPALTPIWGRPADATRNFVVTQLKELQSGEDRYGSVPVQAAYIARGLAAWDAALSDNTSSETDAAIKFAFEMQSDDGAIRGRDRWPPLNSTTYYATVMAAIAVSDAPGWLEGLTDQKQILRVERLKHFLRNTPPKNDHERLMLLWASTFMPTLINKESKHELIEAIWKQQLPDGGWTIWNFATPETYGSGRRAESIRDEREYTSPSSDGYQTALAVIVLRDASVPDDEPRIRRAVEWLKSNQRESGRWWTRSLNTTSRFHFISFSGTAYAALALAKCNALDPVQP